MKTVKYTVLGLVIAMGGWSCLAQDASISSAQFPEAPQLQPHVTIISELSPGGFSSSAAPAVPFAASFEPVHSAAPSRIVDGKFLLINSLHLGMAIFDVELTQQCIASHRCREGNPLMPSSQAGQLSIDFAFVAYGTGISYWLKKHKSRVWWLPPASGVVSHTVGAATGLAHQ
jgi:hypothetical protein